MRLGESEFSGPYESADQIGVDGPGVYVVLCVEKDRRFKVLDVGESGWGSQILKKRIRYHERKSCWQQNCEGKIAFAVLIEPDGKERLRVEESLRRYFKPPCGTNPPK